MVKQNKNFIINGKVPYDNSMELSFKELGKRDVINVTDGRCLGRITDLKIEFPSGKLAGIIVPGRKVNCLFRLFDKSQVYIPVSKILKIGGDAILVDLDCKDVCAPSVKGHKEKPISPPCQPPCPPPFNPTCPPEPCAPPFFSDENDE